MLINVYYAEIRWDDSHFVTRKELEAFLKNHALLIDLHPGYRVCLQDGYFEIQPDFTLKEIIPTPQERRGEEGIKAVWMPVV